MPNNSTDSQYLYNQIEKMPKRNTEMIELKVINSKLWNWKINLAVVAVIRCAIAIETLIRLVFMVQLNRPASHTKHPLSPPPPSHILCLLKVRILFTVFKDNRVQREPHPCMPTPPTPATTTVCSTSKWC